MTDIASKPMPVSIIDAARVYANLSFEGLSWISGTSEQELDFLRYVHRKGELTPHRQTMLNVTKAFAEIGLVQVVHDIDGDGIAWQSQAHKNSWHRILRMVPARQLARPLAQYKER